MLYLFLIKILFILNFIYVDFTKNYNFIINI